MHAVLKCANELQHTQLLIHCVTLRILASFATNAPVCTICFRTVQIYLNVFFHLASFLICSNPWFKTFICNNDELVFLFQRCSTDTNLCVSRSKLQQTVNQFKLTAQCAVHRAWLNGVYKNWAMEFLHKNGVKNLVTLSLQCKLMGNKETLRTLGNLEVTRPKGGKTR